MFEVFKEEKHYLVAVRGAQGMATIVNERGEEYGLFDVLYIVANDNGKLRVFHPPEDVPYRLLSSAYGIHFLGAADNPRYLALLDLTSGSKLPFFGTVVLTTNPTDAPLKHGVFVKSGILNFTHFPIPAYAVKYIEELQDNRFVIESEGRTLLTAVYSPTLQEIYVYDSLNRTVYSFKLEGSLYHIPGNGIFKFEPNYFNTQLKPVELPEVSVQPFDVAKDPGKIVVEE